MLTEHTFQLNAYICSHHKLFFRMNKSLFDKVKGLCKDTGLSEKYLKAITEKMGGSIEDDSTDEAAIETCANLIADVAKESQGEATRWADKSKKGKAGSGNDDDDDDEGKGKKGKPGKSGDDDDDDDSLRKQLADMAKELKELKEGKAKNDRTALVKSLMETHKIPAYLRDTLEKSIKDDDDAEEAIKTFKQNLITNGLETEQSGGSKSASAQQVEEAADSLLESITAK